MHEETLSTVCQIRSYVQIKFYEHTVNVSDICVNIPTLHQVLKLLKTVTSQSFLWRHFKTSRVLKWAASQIHVEVVTDCRGPHLPANKLYWDTRTSPTGLPLACAHCCHSDQTFPDPITAGGCAHRPTTTAHYSETLKGGLGGCGGRWRGGQTGTGASLWHSSPLFPLPPSFWPTSVLSTLRYIDPAWSTGSQQDQNITQLPGARSQKASMWHTFQSLLGKWHKIMTDCWVLYWQWMYRIHIVVKPQPISFHLLTLESNDWACKQIAEQDWRFIVCVCYCL